MLFAIFVPLVKGKPIYHTITVTKECKRELHHFAVLLLAHEHKLAFYVAIHPYLKYIWPSSVKAYTNRASLVFVITIEYEELA